MNAGQRGGEKVRTFVNYIETKKRSDSFNHNFLGEVQPGGIPVDDVSVDSDGVGGMRKEIRHVDCLGKAAKKRRGPLRTNPEGQSELRKTCPPDTRRPTKGGEKKT